MKLWFLSFLFLINVAFSQGIERDLPMHTTFKNYVFQDSTMYFPVFPQEDASTSLIPRENKKRYSNVGHFLYDRELLQKEIHERDDRILLYLTPLFHGSAGVEIAKDSTKRLFQNTRGVRLEAIFGSRFFVHSAFYENQLIVPTYQQQFFSSRGEIYPNYSGNTYSQQNAVFSGAARTKYFKQTGFDFGFAQSYFHWKATNKLSFRWGNSPFFVGTGYRSLIFSDNSPAFMNLQSTYDFLPRLKLVSMKGRGLNLLRRAEQNSVEAFYETKLLSCNTLFFKASKKLLLGLVESTTFFREDSLRRFTPDWTFFVPLPGASIATKDSKVNQIIAILAQEKIGDFLFYQQIGSNSKMEKSFLIQLGLRFKRKNFSLLTEYNFTDVNAYKGRKERIHFTNSNLFLGHIAGANVSELLTQIEWKWKDFKIRSNASYYFKQNKNQVQLLPYLINNQVENHSVFIQIIEASWNFNPTIGLSIFTSFTYRSLTQESNNSSFFHIGMRTSLLNHYVDF